MSVAAAIRALGGPGEPDVFAEVVRLFLADVPIHLLALGAAIAADEKESVRKIAHRLRGGALEIGAVRMAPVCAAIERAARAGSLEDAAARADSLGGEFRPGASRAGTGDSVMAIRRSTLRRIGGESRWSFQLRIR